MDDKTTKFIELAIQLGYLQKEAAEKIHERYLEFAEWSKCDVLVMNVDDENLERELSDIKQFLEK